MQHSTAALGAYSCPLKPARLTKITGKQQKGVDRHMDAPRERPTEGGWLSHRVTKYDTTTRTRAWVSYQKAPSYSLEKQLLGMISAQGSKSQESSQNSSQGRQVLSMGLLEAATGLSASPGASGFTRRHNVAISTQGRSVDLQLN